MPPLDEDFQDMASSTVSDLDENTGKEGAAAPAEPTDAKSSTATDEAASDDSDLLSVVRDVRGKKSSEEQPASSAEGEEDEDQDGADKAGKTDDEDYSDVPFHKHPRFQHLVRELKAHKQDAQRYHNVQGFLSQAGLSDEEAADGLSIMGLAKTDPVSAWAQIQPWVQKLVVAAGVVLPDDLKQRVETGEMSREAALEISKARAMHQSAEATASFREQQRTRQEATSRQEACMAAATDWEAHRRARDPNFDAKVEPLRREIAFLQRTEGVPNTPDGVKEQLKKAYKAVNDAVRPTVAAPAPAQRPAIRPVTGGAVAGGQQPENQSTLDIVRSRRRAG